MRAPSKRLREKNRLGVGGAEPVNKLVVTGLNGHHLPQSPELFKSRATRGGKRSRDKGARGERALVKFLRANGFAAEKISRTGYTGADLSVPLLGIDRTVEVKVRGDGFRQIYEWLAGRDILIVKADRQDPLIVIRLRDAIEIAAAAERGRS
jgi:hypothetical protein